MSSEALNYIWFKSIFWLVINVGLTDWFKNADYNWRTQLHVGATLHVGNHVGASLHVGNQCGV